MTFSFDSIHFFKMFFPLQKPLKCDKIICFIWSRVFTNQEPAVAEITFCKLIISIHCVFIDNIPAVGNLHCQFVDNSGSQSKASIRIWIV